MANDLSGYKGALEAEVEKDALTGKYTVNVTKYSAGVKIGEDTYEYTPESSGGSEDPEPVEPTPDPEEPSTEEPTEEEGE